MKITDERKKDKIRPNIFVSRAVGEVFEDASGEICIKLASHHRQNNAFCIQSNDVLTYHKNSYAKLLDAEIIIHPEAEE